MRAGFWSQYFVSLLVPRLPTLIALGNAQPFHGAIIPLVFGVTGFCTGLTHTRLDPPTSANKRPCENVNASARRDAVGPKLGPSPHSPSCPNVPAIFSPKMAC